MRFEDPSLYINRELSMLAFQRRVLEEAEDKSLPVYERLKFLGIVSSNLDEFFMVRVAGVKQQLISGLTERSADGKTPQEQLLAVAESAQTLVAEQYKIATDLFVDIKEKASASIVSGIELNAEQQVAAKEYFASVVFPALTPLAVDPGHPFPHLRNKSLNLAVMLRREASRRRKRDPRSSSLAVVQVPSVLNRVVRFASEGVTHYFLLEDLIASHVADLFPGFKVLESSPFRVTRNWDLNFDEEDSDDLLSTIQEEVRRRDRGAAVRLELGAAASAGLEQTL